MRADSKSLMAILPLPFRWFALSLAVTVFSQFGDYFSTLYGLSRGLREGSAFVSLVGQEADLLLRLAFTFGLLLPLYLIATTKNLHDLGKGGIALVALAVFSAVITPALTVEGLIRNLILTGVCPC